MRGQSTAQIFRSCWVEIGVAHLQSQPREQTVQSQGYQAAAPRILPSSGSGELCGVTLALWMAV